MIEVRNLTKTYGDHEAISDISFTVEKGHIYGFLGPNGAGKSTTMNIITGYLAATSGEVTINGFDILREARQAKSSIGYLPETPPLYMDMTVREYLSFAAELKGIGKQDRADAIDETMRITMLEDVSGRLIKNLSKGYKQRVGLAQAIIGLPEVLILDEPTSGLDPKQIMEIRDLIRQLGETHTVLLSSHILSEISAVCDRVIMISGGKIVADDTLKNLTAEKDLETVFLELTDAERMDAMDAMDIAREQAMQEAQKQVSSEQTSAGEEAVEAVSDETETGDASSMPENASMQEQCESGKEADESNEADASEKEAENDERNL